MLKKRRVSALAVHFALSFFREALLVSQRRAWHICWEKVCSDTALKHVSICAPQSKSFAMLNAKSGRRIALLGDGCGIFGHWIPIP